MRYYGIDDTNFTRSLPAWTVDKAVPFEIIARPLKYGNDVLLNNKQFQEFYIFQNNLNPHGIIAVDKNRTVYLKVIEAQPVLFDANPSYSVPYNVLDIPVNDFEKFVTKTHYLKPRMVQASLPTEQWLQMFGLKK